MDHPHTKDILDLTKGDQQLLEDYDSCVDFKKSRFNISSNELFWLRVIFNLPMIILATITLIGMSPLYLFFVESEWGVFITFFSSITMFLAEHNPTRWQNAAVLSSQLAMCFNIVITLLFWFWLNPGTGKIPPFDRFMMDAHHAFPLFTSIANLVLNNQYFLKKNGRDCFYAGIIYMVINGYITKQYLSENGIYPWPCDWHNNTLSFAAYVLQAVILYLIQMELARYTQRIFQTK
jgi:hypothetical protein